MRPSHTIILAQRGLIARADFDGNTPPKLLESSVQRAHDSGDVTDTFLAALDLASGSGKKVWLISEDLWIQNVTIPAHSTTGLDSRGIKRILAYESEPLSGIPTKDSALGFTLEIDDPQNRTYAIVQAPNSLLDALASRVERDGAVLSGLAHPTAFGHDWKQFTPEDRGKIGEFLGAAMKAFLEVPCARPLITVDARPIKTSKLIAYALVAEVLMAAACWWHGSNLATERTALEGTSATSKKSAQQQAEVEKKVKESRDEFEKLKKANDTLEAELAEHDKRMTAQRAAFSRLLERLSQTRNENIMIQKISTKGDGLTLEALAMQPGDADDWGAKLSEQLAPTGWDVQPLQKKALDRMPGGGPWNVTFSLNRQEIMPSKTAKPAAQARPMLPPVKKISRAEVQ